VARTVQSLLDERAAALIGRDRERAALLDLVEGETPLVAAVHGIAGVGKSALLHAAAVDARARGVTVVTLDGSTFEPTERGFRAALGDAIERPSGRVLLTIDAYERLGLLDTWLRQRFVPSLPEEVRLLLAGRHAPLAWQRDLGDLVRVLRLDDLGSDDALELLARSGIGGAAARRIARLAGGHPLSLQLAAQALAARPGQPVDAAVLGTIVDELAERYLAGLDPMTRRALDAASVVRRATLTLLAAMLRDDDAGELFERLRVLPFVELGPEGLVLHDTVRTTTSALLHAADPARHRAHRSAAWARLRAELRTASRAEHWRYTADMLYLVENPIVRDAFFPTGPDELVTEPARPGDREAILAMATDPLTRDWLDAAPETFVVVRDVAGTVRGFSCIVQLRDVPLALARRDPVVRACAEHLRREPVPPGQRTLLHRHSVALDDAARAKEWLETKRAYLELRPDLRRMYVPVEDAGAEGALAALGPLGFEPVGSDGERTLLLNDFGPGSVDGWLGDVVGRELQAEEPPLIEDHELTRLKLGVLRHLQRRQGTTVTREELLREVWGHQWTGGSNVVEVVVSSLRRKLGERAPVLVTVRGVGYRFGALE
jgi:hypothetical protein